MVYLIISKRISHLEANKVLPTQAIEAMIQNSRNHPISSISNLPRIHSGQKTKMMTLELLIISLAK